MFKKDISKHILTFPHVAKEDNLALGYKPVAWALSCPAPHLPQSTAR